MNIQELRNRKTELCESIAKLIERFEIETTIPVLEKLTYKRIYSETEYNGVPTVALDFDFDYAIEPQTAPII